MEDFLSSFQPDKLPSEWGQELNLSDRINLEASQASESNWTVSNDLQFTLMQWACYEPEGRMLAQYRRIKSPQERAISFRQALNRRFVVAFTSYDHQGPLNPFYASDLADTLEALADEAQRDMTWRVMPRPDWLSSNDKTDYIKGLMNTLVGALKTATESTRDPTRAAAPTTRSHRLSGSPEKILFHVLFIQQQASDFMLGVLEEILDEAPMDDRKGIANSVKDDVKAIAQQLEHCRARKAYQTRFRRIAGSLALTGEWRAGS